MSSPPQRRSGCQARRDHGPDHSQGLAPLAGGESVHDQRRRTGHEHGRTHSLERPERDQVVRAGGQAAKRGTGREDDKAAAIDPPSPLDVAQSAERKKQRGYAEQIDHHYPLDGVHVHSQVLHDGGKGYVYDASVQSGHKDGHRREREDNPFFGMERIFLISQSFTGVCNLRCGRSHAFGRKTGASGRILEGLGSWRVTGQDLFEVLHGLRRGSRGAVENLVRGDVLLVV